MRNGRQSRSHPPLPPAPDHSPQRNRRPKTRHNSPLRPH
jgi:hypothetical protein